MSLAEVLAELAKLFTYPSFLLVFCLGVMAVAITTSTVEVHQYNKRVVNGVDFSEFPEEAKVTEQIKWVKERHPSGQCSSGLATRMINKYHYQMNHT